LSLLDLNAFSAPGRRERIGKKEGSSDTKGERRQEKEGIKKKKSMVF